MNRRDDRVPSFEEATRDILRERVGVGAVLVLVLLLVGAAVFCAGCRSGEDHPSSEPIDPISQARYRETLAQVYSNLVTQVRPAVIEALTHSTVRTDSWKRAQLGVVDDTAALCSTVLSLGGPK